MAVVGVIITILALFKFPMEKAVKFIKIFLIFALIVALIHGVLSMVFATHVQRLMKVVYEETLGTQPTWTFKSAAFIAIITQVVCVVAYVICDKKIVNKEIKNVEKEKVDAVATPKKVEESAEKQIQTLMNAELLTIGLLKEYRALSADNILSTADYIDKKVRLLQFAENKIKKALPNILTKCTFEEVVQAERIVVDLLKEYKKLLDEGAISNADFVDKKASLLTYIIN